MLPYFPAISIIRTWKFSLKVKYTLFFLSMMKYLFQTILCQVHCIQSFRCFKKRFYIITIFQNRLLHLLIILFQVQPLIFQDPLHVMKHFKSNNKVMQLPGCRIIQTQKCHTASLYLFSILPAIRKFIFCTFFFLFRKIGNDIWDLQPFPHSFS